MSDSKENNPTQVQPVDLSALQNLSFGPDWSEGQARSTKTTHHTRPPHKDRRTRPPLKDSKDRRTRSPLNKGRTHAPLTHKEESFVPTVQVLFYPEDAPFEKLTKALRHSCRTYELFEIAQLILEKPERTVIVIKPLEQSGEGVSRQFYCTVPENLPFENEDTAIAYVLEHRLGDFCTREEVEVEAPKGSFPFVTKCPQTGVLLGPPNYHRYQNTVREHHAAYIKNMPLERYTERLERISDEESIAAWVESMKRQMRYKVQPEGEEAVYFDTLEALKLHLLSKQRNQIVHPYETVRLSGAHFDKLPQGNLRRSIERAFELQRRFPLDTANNLRGRLRRMKFNIYKRGSKGAAYVCAVKRKFRDEHTVFSDSIQSLVEFLDQHPDIDVAALPEQYLGFSLPEKPAEGDAPSLTPEQESKLHTLTQNLHWLLAEGYLTEYSNGHLLIQPVLSAGEHHEQSTDNPESLTKEKSAAQADISEDMSSPPAPENDESSSAQQT